jgi:hypothetical protein
MRRARAWGRRTRRGLFIVQVRGGGTECTTSGRREADFNLMDMNSYIGNVALGWIVSSLGLGLEHLALWDQPWRLAEPWDHVVGVLTLLGGCAVWAWRQTLIGPIDPWLAVFAFGLISTSGLWIAVAYWLRRGFKFIQRNGERHRALARELEGTDGPVVDPRRN